MWVYCKKLTPYFKNARARRRRKKWVLQSPIMRGKEGKPILMEGESQFVSRPLPIIRGEGDQHPCSGDRSWDSATQNKIAPAAHHFFIIVVFCKELDIRFFFQGLLFSLTNSISAPEQIRRKKRRAPTGEYFSISDGLIREGIGKQR